MIKRTDIVAKKSSKSSVYEMLVAGLDDSVAYSKGSDTSLAVTRVPAPPPPIRAREVRQIRNRMNLSQGRFAAALNVSSKAVQGWEQGLRKPGSASLRLLQIAALQPQVFADLAGIGSTSTPVGKKSKTKVLAKK